MAALITWASITHQYIKGNKARCNQPRVEFLNSEHVCVWKSVSRDARTMPHALLRVAFAKLTCEMSWWSVLQNMFHPQPVEEPIIIDMPMLSQPNSRHLKIWMFCTKELCKSRSPRVASFNTGGLKATGITFSPLENQNNGVRFVVGLMAGGLVIYDNAMFLPLFETVSRLVVVWVWQNICQGKLPSSMLGITRNILFRNLLKRFCILTMLAGSKKVCERLAARTRLAVLAPSLVFTISLGNFNQVCGKQTFHTGTLGSRPAWTQLAVLARDRFPNKHQFKQNLDALQTPFFFPQLLAAKICRTLWCRNATTFCHSQHATALFSKELGKLINSSFYSLSSLLEILLSPRPRRSLTLLACGRKLHHT